MPRGVCVMIITNKQIKLHQSGQSGMLAGAEANYAGDTWEYTFDCPTPTPRK